MHYHQIPIFYRRPLGVHWGVHWASIGRPLGVQYRCPQVLYPGPMGPRKKLWGPWALGPGMSMRDKDTRNTAGRKGPEKEGPRKRRGLLCTICIRSRSSLLSTSFLLILRMCNHVPWGGTVDGIIKMPFACLHFLVFVSRLRAHHRPKCWK